jgi:hypothetical protein
MSVQATIKAKFDRLRSLLDERMGRLWAANEALSLGQGGVAIVSIATGVSRSRIHSGKRELKQLIGDIDLVPTPRRGNPSPRVVIARYRIRRPGAGRKLTEVKQPGITAALGRLLTDEVAGDPMSEQRWVRNSLRRLSECLKIEGYKAGSTVVSRLLKDMGFSLKANRRKQGRSGQCPQRDAQFHYIAAMRNDASPRESRSLALTPRRRN